MVIRVETSRYIGSSSKALKKSTESGCVLDSWQLPFKFICQKLCDVQHKHEKMKQRKMHVKCDDICREFLVNMRRVSPIIRPAFDPHMSPPIPKKKSKPGWGDVFPPVTSLRQCSSRSVTKTLSGKGTNSHRRSHGSVWGFPEFFTLNLTSRSPPSGVN